MDENEKFNWEEWQNDGITMPPAASISHPYDEELLLKEIAIHEASHFVFDILAEKANIGFKRVASIEVMPASVNDGKIKFPTGLTHGFGCPLAQKPFPSQKEVDNWYVSDKSRKRIFFRLFGLLSGFTSYKTFFQNTDYFIGYADANLNQSQIPFFKLDTLNFNFISDFDKAQKQLVLLGITAKSKQRAFMQKLITEIKLVMDKKQISASIQFVADNLLEAKGKKIQGRELEKIRNKVNRMTKGISIDKQLRKYCKKTYNETPI